MRIAQLATNTESVPPTGYGGTEIVVSLLTEALVKNGHDVTLFASGDSKTAAKLISVTDEALRLLKDMPQRRWQAFDIRTLLKLQDRRDQFDIVHNHMGWQALPWLDLIGLPSITTNHNPVKPYNFPIYETYKHLPYVAISDAYRRLNHPETLNYVGTVYNGIDFEAYPETASGSRDYLLFLGRICHDKGTREAIEIAEKTNLPLKIAGKIDEPDREYFEKFVKPRLQGKIEYVGEVDHSKKLQLYKNALAVVHAINFDEPFGLVMVEAQACGVPLLAIDRGSVPEILKDGETAVIAKNVDELIARHKELHKLKPADCSKRMRNLFGQERMVSEYEKLYDQVIKDGSTAIGVKRYATT
jgi:glycosyltransferase involved in cell wall biosynthesis